MDGKEEEEKKKVLLEESFRSAVVVARRRRSMLPNNFLLSYVDSRSQRKGPANRRGNEDVYPNNDYLRRAINLDHPRGGNFIYQKNFPFNLYTFRERFSPFHVQIRSTFFLQNS